MSPEAVTVLGCILCFLGGGLVGGANVARYLAPVRVVYRDPPTLQELWFRAYREARRLWVTASTNIEGVEALEAIYRKTADAAVASAKKTKCWQCGALPVFPEELKL